MAIAGAAQTLSQDVSRDMWDVKSLDRTRNQQTRNTSIGLLLSHMAHVLNARITKRWLRGAVGNDVIKYTHALQTR